MTKRNPKEYAYEMDQISEKIFKEPKLYQNLTEFSISGAGANGYATKNDSVNYVLNSTGLRGPELGSLDLLVAGCSQTFGAGIPDESDTWPSLLAKSLGYSYANIAKPGASIQVITQSIFAYVKKYGRPKVICINIPSLYRFTLPLRSDINIYPYGGGLSLVNQHSVVNDDVHLFDMNMTPTGTEADDLDNWPTYAKRPYDLSKVMSYEVAMYLSMMSLNYVIEFCREIGVPFLFTTWYPDTDNFLKRKLAYTLDPRTSGDNKMDMSGYVSLDNLELFIRDAVNIKTCHENIENKPHWDYALDSGRHMGAHMHKHFAEMFYEKLSRMI